MIDERRKLIDLSHRIRDGLVTYKGLPAPVICDFISRKDSEQYYAPGTQFHIGRIDMVANTGTYVDVPFHRYPEGTDIGDATLAALADLPGVVVRVGEQTTAIDDDVFDGIEVAGKAVLVQTGWSRHWNTDRYFEGHPYLTEAAAVRLRESGAALVGIDSLNIDNINDGRRPVHTVLLGADTLVVEHMANLQALPDSGFRFFAVPPKVAGMGTFPVRAFAIVSF